MNGKINIRKYSTADKKSVIDLFRLNTPGYFAKREEQDLVYYLDKHSENYYIIESENEILGCGGINFGEDITVAKISWDIFHPDYQGKGFGKMLTTFRIEKIKENNSIKTISVRTSQLAFRFYAKFGFETKEISKDYWAEGFDLYTMEFRIKEIQTESGRNW